MPFVDTHCHLDFDSFNSSRDETVEQCIRKGIQKIVVPGVSRAQWAKVFELVNKYEIVKPAVGLHPYFVSEHSLSDLEDLEELLLDKSSQLVALGEIGLDDERPDYEKQCLFFEKQLLLAEQYGLPVIVHMRKNHGQGLKRVRQRKLVGGVVHAFSGSSQDAESWIDLGFKIGVGGVITYPRAKKTRATIASVPLESIVIETDAPDMSVNGGERGKGSPLMLLEVFDALCLLRKESPKVLERALWDNYLSLFSGE